MHALKDIAEKMCKKKQPPPKLSNVRFLFMQKMSGLFLWIYLTRYGGKSPPDRNWHPHKRPPTNSFCSLSFISAMSPFLLTTPGHPSHHLFTCFHPSLPVGRIQHHTRQQCLLLCVILSSTRDGVMVQYDSVYISVSTSPSYKISYFLHLDIPLNISSHASIAVCL